MRIGIGYDTHRLAEGRKLILGGVNIAHKTGLLGHSDADVLVHAIMDALLGAVAKGDIGHHFPDTDAQFKGASSLTLLKTVAHMLAVEHYQIVNIDSIILAQKPKLAPYINDMRQNIANALNCPIANISIKATTEEGLGFVGTESGMSAQAVCLIEKQI